MGSGASVEQLEKLDELDEEQQKEIRSKYADLLSTGKTNEEAIALLDAAEAASCQPLAFIKLVDLLEAVQTAVNSGKTPLVVDHSADSKVDTFYSYHTAIILDGKKMGIEKSIQKIPIAEILENARKKLVAAIKNGCPLVICLQQSVTDFAETFTDEAQQRNSNTMLDFKDGMWKYFPGDVFVNSGKGLLSPENMDALFREEDKVSTDGVAHCRSPDDFFVVITSRFDPTEVESYLFEQEWGLPKPSSAYQFIAIQYDEDVPLLD
jgi:hypothetical protein